jgi:hypothetical protein
MEAYFEFVRVHAPQLEEMKRQEVFTIFDEAIERILDVLVLCQKHLDGEINLLERNLRQE